MWQIIRPDINIDFVGRRVLALTFSIVLTAVGILAIVFRGGLNMGIDFAGGTIVQIRFTEAVDVQKIRSALEPLGIASSAIQQIGTPSDHEFIIRTSIQDESEKAVSEKIQAELERTFGKDKVEIRRVEMVGPKIGKDLREKALLTVYYSLLFMAIYIAGRFESKWIKSIVISAGLFGGLKILEALGIGYGILSILALVVTVAIFWVFHLPYALGAILSLIHDVMMIVGIFAILNKEFDLTVIAAILTIIGYSLNDTIIVFDRIRENLRKERGIDFKEIVNRSVNQTLSRTILTSGTTLIVVLALLIFGSAVIKDFALALFIGVLTGTYSSIFIAVPVLILYEERLIARKGVKVEELLKKPTRA
ncbi:MAG: protein translocase subunit SecF [Syntrophobacterales bacterium]|nr:protein translocase subunit SecF [Syntrophobacterales bacterium]